MIFFVWSEANMSPIKMKISYKFLFYFVLFRVWVSVYMCVRVYTNAYVCDTYVHIVCGSWEQQWKHRPSILDTKFLTVLEFPK